MIRLVHTLSSLALSRSRLFFDKGSAYFEQFSAVKEAMLAYDKVSAYFEQFSAFKESAFL
jgi:hypothetical protein